VEFLAGRWQKHERVQSWNLMGPLVDGERVHEWHLSMWYYQSKSSPKVNLKIGAEQRGHQLDHSREESLGQAHAQDVTSLWQALPMKTR